MSMIFTLRMLCDEDDNFIRDYKVMYDMSLLDFHYFICEELGYDATNMASFFTSDSRWTKLREFTLLDMGAEGLSPDDEPPMPMADVLLGQIMQHNHDRLIYMFDVFEERGMYLELMATTKSEPSEIYPQVAMIHGVAPDQFDIENSVKNASIFEEAMDDFSEFEGDEYMDDES